MNIIVRHDSGKDIISAQEGDTVLVALQRAGIVIDAPCGGAGTCRKCRVLLHDGEGVSYQLACQIKAADGIEVTLQQSHDMAVSMSGDTYQWEADGSAKGYGVAIDVGTTTIACRLYNRETGELLGSIGNSNPELVFGADVIARIKASIEGHLEDMVRILGDELALMAKKLIRRAKIDVQDITQVVIAGNTVMQTIAAGVDPEPIGVAPYEALTLFGDEHDYAAFAAEGIADGKVYFTPCVAGYVGGDVVCGMLAMDMGRSEKPMLLLDLGTNGEIALGDKNGIISCATAAGPVFEGANIKYGMPAYPGAISQVKFEDGELKLTVIGDEEPSGICGTGLIDAVALMLDHGLILPGGRVVPADDIDPEEAGGLEAFMDVEDDAPCLRLTDSISVTQKDVRCLQLAKAAITGGILTLMHGRGNEFEDIGSLAIAGGFGQYMNLRNAARVGLFPEELLHCAHSVGNTAIEGTSAILINEGAKRHMDEIMETCDYIELSTSMEFNKFYVDEMMF